MSTRPHNAALEQALANVADPFRSRLIEKYLSLRDAFAGAMFDAVGLRSGVFAETLLRWLQHALTGSHIAFGTHIGNFEDECTKLQKLPKTAGHESLRVVLPRAISFLYTIRNKRGIGHAGGDVEANRIDASTCVRVSDWCICELLRFYHGLSLEEAQVVVDAISVKEIPSVWSVNGRTRILNTSLDYKSQALLLLYSRPEDVLLAEDVLDSIEYPDPSKFGSRILGPLHRERLIEWDRDNNAVLLSPKGAKFVEQRVLPRTSNGG